MKEKSGQKLDLLQYVMANSEFLTKEKNSWMKPVMEVVRKTSVFFQPQIRTKIMNEGWASYWHETLFLQDDRIEGHEVDFARTHSGVTSMPRVGLNPYALGMRMFYNIEQMVDKGKYSVGFKRIGDAMERKQFDLQTGKGKEFIFNLRDNFCDSMFINTFIDQDFIDRYKLFVAGRRLNRARGVWEYYVQSRSAEKYKQMVIDTLYHPPCFEIREGKSGSLYLVHKFEGKPLVKEFIVNTMLGIEYLWGKHVHMETSEVVQAAPVQTRIPIPGLTMPVEDNKQKEIQWQRVRYTMRNRKLSKKNV